MTNSPNPFIAAAVLTGLLLFGVLFNQLVGWLEKKGYSRGYTALLVITGTAVTLAGAIPIVGLVPVLWVLACFAASGLPMTLGDIARNTTARKADELRTIAVAKEMLTDDQPQSGRIRDAAGDYAGRERQ